MSSESNFSATKEFLVAHHCAKLVDRATSTEEKRMLSAEVFSALLRALKRPIGFDGRR